jgi:hypothetical protein
MRFLVYKKTFVAPIVGFISACMSSAMPPKQNLITLRMYAYKLCLGDSLYGIMLQWYVCCF